ncbi:hypothetical protein BU14_0315s0001 [Porphyra umbilicalis]|uniref:ER membrane protein complex subunit 2 n=1 Tax=Porphyra umbilicalis TaxID=2786 RepID=A0A1X6NZE2_PORUM|nr:hypothetical protein BU14_0315s0001 [Porphyra umbilicalis]|eukprot:OSX73991.1 hypothetical protein BU14_0315s0001 [Porphyra umbilicalis]
MRPYYAGLEAAAAAAWEVGATAVGDAAAATLSAVFPGTPRLDRLLALRAEAVGDVAAAASTYRSAIAAAPATSAGAAKRQVALAKGAGRPAAAAALLRAYLATWATDVGAWEELGALAAAAGRADEAVFAAAEAFTLAPGGWARPTRLADAYYTAGGGDALRRARVYYAVSLRARRRGNVRALVGLWLAASALEVERGEGGGGVPMGRTVGTGGTR